MLNLIVKVVLFVCFTPSVFASGFASQVASNSEFQNFILQRTELRLAPILTSSTLSKIVVFIADPRSHGVFAECPVRTVYDLQNCTPLSLIISLNQIGGAQFDNKFRQSFDARTQHGIFTGDVLAMAILGGAAGGILGLLSGAELAASGYFIRNRYSDFPKYNETGLGRYIGVWAIGGVAVVGGLSALLQWTDNVDARKFADQIGSTPFEERIAAHLRENAGTETVEEMSGLNLKLYEVYKEAIAETVWSFVGA